LHTNKYNTQSQMATNGLIGAWSAVCQSTNRKYSQNTINWMSNSMLMLNQL